MESPIPEVYDLGKDLAELENLAPKTDLAKHRRTFADLMREEASPLADKAGQATDRATAGEAPQPRLPGLAPEAREEGVHGQGRPQNPPSLPRQMDAGDLGL